MRDFSARKAQLDARLAELDDRIHKIEDQLDDPVTKDWEDSAIEREGDEVLEGMGSQGLKGPELGSWPMARNMPPTGRVHSSPLWLLTTASPVTPSSTRSRVRATASLSSASGTSP